MPFVGRNKGTALSTRAIAFVRGHKVLDTPGKRFANGEAFHSTFNFLGKLAGFPECFVYSPAKLAVGNFLRARLGYTSIRRSHQYAIPLRAPGGCHTLT